jgi:ATP-dependent RNA helicase SUPV3L1/SUV3
MATTSMLSILGATPDDMEEILKGLGYRADAVTAEEAAAFLASQGGPAVEPAPADETAPEQGDAETETPATDAAAESAETAPAEAQAEQVSGEDGSAPAEAEAPAEPKPVLLWRPGTRQDNQRGGRHHGDQRRGGQRHGERHGQAEGRDGGRKGAPARAKTQDGKPGGQRKERPDRHERHDRGGKFEGRPQRKEKPIDPDSPFAKLAALKEQLKK